MASSSDSSRETGSGTAVNLPHPPKRRKTPRACDYCREHKLRCDFSVDLTTANGRPICKHCADFGIACLISSPSERRRTLAVKADDISVATSDASASTLWQLDERVLDDPRYSGESSLSAIIAQFITMIGGRDQQLRTLERQLTAAGVQPTGTDNFLLLPQIRYPPSAEANEQDLSHASLDQAIVKLLVERYLTYIQPLNAIVSRKEVFRAIDLSAHSTKVTSFSPVALSLLCVSAMQRETPTSVRAALLFHLRQRRSTVFRSSVESVQSLLLISQNIELMAPDTNDAAGMSLNLTGLAVRMAQDLGMHRDLASLGVSPARVRRLARIWSSCVIIDRWYSLCYGQPCLISLDDCDAPPPSPCDNEEDEEEEQPGVVQATRKRLHEAHVAHFELVILIGRLHKLAFGPKGARTELHNNLRQLINDMDVWTARLPPSLRFSMQQTEPPSVEAGFLFAMKVAIDFLVYRASLNSPPDAVPLQSPDAWTCLVRQSAEALEWLASPEGLPCLDSYSIVLYFMIQCTIIHFYEASRGGSLHSLRVARQSLQNRGTVATQASSRGQIYDPYGPQDQEQHTSNGGARASDGAAPSPSPESGTGPPKLLRLRVKISALVSMLLEVAEQRRAAVLSHRDKASSASSRTSTSHLRPPAPAMATAPATPSSPYPVSALLNHSGPQPPRHHPSQHKQTLPPRQQASPQHRTVPSSLSHGIVSSMQDAHIPPSERQGAANGVLPPGQGGVSPSRHGPPYFGNLASHLASHHQLHHAAQAAYSTHPMAGVPDVPPYPTPSSGAGSIHDPAFFATVSPRNFEDLDLTTLQRWADALLRNPNQFDQQQQQGQLQQAAAAAASAAAGGPAYPR